MAVAGDIPPEIWHEALIYLDPSDLLRLRLVSHWMLNILSDSSYAQYLIECFSSGVYDPLHSGLSYSERLEIIRRRESAWRTMRPVRRFDVPIGFKASGLYDLTGGTFLLGRSSNPEFVHTSGYSVLRLPSSGDVDVGEGGGGGGKRWRDFELDVDVVDFGLSVHEHDLNVVVTQRQVEGPPPEGHGHGHGLLIMLAKFELHIRQFSTGELHPDAAQPVIILRAQGLVIQRAHAMVEIVGDLAVVLLFFPFMVGMRLDSLYVVNWRTGVVFEHPRFPPHTHRSFVFLDPTTIMLQNMRTLALDVYQIYERGTGQMAFRQITSLNLPEKLPGVRLISCQARAEPNPTTPSSSGPPPPSSRPFRNKPENAIVIISMTLMYAPHSTMSMTLIAHRSALLDAAKKAMNVESLGESDGDGDSVEGVPYEEWGIDTTSWFEAGASWITQTSGERFACLTHETSYTAIRVYDFNQRHVRRLLAQQGTSRVRDSGHTEEVVNGRRKLHVTAWFARPIEFGLAHVQSTLEEPCTADGVLIDEENLLLLTTDRSTYRIKTVEGLHFG
ncbi:hypothetical protein PENSPDRAFT_751148 [Peniophora sp. CONT]|nr:hypothetical protein PENSPDRAFT_751148 [Peniophora sp. CONT]